MHQRVPTAILDHEVVLVVGLEVPQRDSGRLVAMDRDEAGREDVDLAEVRDGRLKPFSLTATASVSTTMLAAAVPLFATVRILEAAASGMK
jgi:hypothetical protein